MIAGDPSAKVGTSTKYEHTSKFTLASQRSFLQKTKKASCKAAFMFVCMGVGSDVPILFEMQVDPKEQ